MDLQLEQKVELLDSDTEHIPTQMEVRLFEQHISFRLSIQTIVNDLLSKAACSAELAGGGPAAETDAFKHALHAARSTLCMIPPLPAWVGCREADPWTKEDFWEDLLNNAPQSAGAANSVRYVPFSA
jgi:hypothetical protein